MTKLGQGVQSLGALPIPHLNSQEFVGGRSNRVLGRSIVSISSGILIKLQIYEILDVINF